MSDVIQYKEQLGDDHLPIAQQLAPSDTRNEYVQFLKQYAFVLPVYIQTFHKKRSECERYIAEGVNEDENRANLKKYEVLIQRFSTLFVLVQADEDVQKNHVYTERDMELLKLVQSQIKRSPIYK
jgi:hypothetical protein